MVNLSTVKHIKVENQPDKPLGEANSKVLRVLGDIREYHMTSFFPREIT